MDGGAWWATVHGVPKGWTWLSNFKQQSRTSFYSSSLFSLLLIQQRAKPTGEDPDAGKDWRRKEKGAAEDEMIRQPHGLNGHEFEQIPAESRGQRSLVRCSPLGRWLSDQTNNNKYLLQHYSQWPEYGNNLCPSAHEWIKMLWSVCTHTHTHTHTHNGETRIYSAMRNKILQFLTFGNYAKYYEISRTEKTNSVCYHLYMEAKKVETRVIETRE